MRRLLLGVALLGLAGCSSVPVSPVVAEAFTTSGSDWVLQRDDGCGFCPGTEGFGDGTAQNHALFVFANGRTVLVAFNGGHDVDASGDRPTHRAPNITYDGAELHALLLDAPRGQRGEQWVVNVHTAHLDPPTRVRELLQLWSANATDDACTDESHNLLRRTERGIERQDFSCGPAGGAMAELDLDLHQIAAAVYHGGAGSGIMGRIDGLD
ncbi:MAG: hypothetical protein LC624_07150 [Halobacteriales archaeon]|nr:hypothetical protein [Halobacteriales archaeon]